MREVGSPLISLGRLCDEIREEREAMCSARVGTSSRDGGSLLRGGGESSGDMGRKLLSSGGRLLTNSPQSGVGRPGVGRN